MTVGARSTVHADHVRIEFSGDFSLDGVLPACERSFRSAVDSGRKAMLVDVRGVTGREPSMAERYEWAVRIAELQSVHEPRMRVALLGHEPLIHPERFGEIVATRYGALLRTFTDESLARQWLLGVP